MTRRASARLTPAIVPPSVSYESQSQDVAALDNKRLRRLWQVVPAPHWRDRLPVSVGLPLDFARRTRYGRDIEARYPSGKGEVCKTFMRGFDSHPRLQRFLVLP